jgi:hypothetical protein
MLHITVDVSDDDDTCTGRTRNTSIWIDLAAAAMKNVTDACGIIRNSNGVGVGVEGEHGEEIRGKRDEGGEGGEESARKKNREDDAAAQDSRAASDRDIETWMSVRALLQSFVDLEPCVIQPWSNGVHCG